MKSTYIWPILFLIFGVSEQLQISEDCDEDELAAAASSSTYSKQLGQTLPKNNLMGNMMPQSTELFQAQPKQQFKKTQTVRKQLKPQQVRRNRPPPIPKRQIVNRRQQRPMNLVIKPIIQHSKPMETVTKRKFAEFFPSYPFKKPKRILLPAFDEYDTYPDTDYIHEVVIPETRGYDYVENSPYNIPCDPNAPEYKDVSTEIEDYTELAREMGKSIETPSEEESSTSLFKSSETPTTEKEIEVSTTPPVSESGIETRNDSIPIGNIDEPLKKFMEMLLRGILALISCIKSRSPMFDDTISKLIETALTTANCNLNKS